MWPTENSKLHSHVLGFEKSKHIIASKQSPFSVETTSTCQAINLSLTCNYMKASDIHALDTTDTKSLTGTSKFEVSYHEQLHTHCKGTGTSTLDTSVPLKFMPKKKTGKQAAPMHSGLPILAGQSPCVHISRYSPVSTSLQLTPATPATPRHTGTSSHPSFHLPPWGTSFLLTKLWSNHHRLSSLR